MLVNILKLSIHRYIYQPHLAHCFKMAYFQQPTRSKEHYKQFAQKNNNQSTNNPFPPKMFLKRTGRYFDNSIYRERDNQFQAQFDKEREQMWMNNKKTYTAIPDNSYIYKKPINQLLSAKWLDSIETRIANQNGPSLKKLIQKLCQQQQIQAKQIIEYNILKDILPFLIKSKFNFSQSQLTIQLIFDRLLLSQFILNDPPSFTKDLDYIQFIHINKTNIMELIKKTTNIVHLLRFAAYLNDIQMRRSYISRWKYIYNQINQAIFSTISELSASVDYSTAQSFLIVELFQQIIREQISPEEKKFINYFCSQIHFFEAAALKLFLFKFSRLLAEADTSVVAPIFDLIRMDSNGIIKEMRQAQILPFIQILRQMTGNKIQLCAKMDDCYQFLFEKVFKKIQDRGILTYSTPFLFSFLTQISKRLYLQKSEPFFIQKLFLCFKLFILNCKYDNAKTVETNLANFYTVLLALQNNQYWNPSNYKKYISDLLIPIKYVSDKHFFIRQSQVVKYWNKVLDNKLVVRHSMDKSLSIAKVMRLLQRKLQNMQMSQAMAIFMGMLVQKSEWYILQIKMQISQSWYFSILNKINSILLKQNSLLFYSEIFVALMESVADFGQVCTDILKTINRIDKIDYQVVFQLFLESAYKITMLGKQKCDKTYLNSLTFIFGYYINQLQKPQLLMNSANFYFFLGRMIRFIKNPLNFNEYHINIYRLLEFVLSDQNKDQIISSLIQFNMRGLFIQIRQVMQLKRYTNINQLQYKILRFKIEHILPYEDLFRIYDRFIARSNYSLTTIDIQLISSLFNKDYQLKLDPPNQDNFILYVSNRKEFAKLEHYQQQVNAIVQSANSRKLGQYLYSSYGGQKFIHSSIFNKIWNAFLEKLQNPQYILCISILQKYDSEMTRHELIRPFIRKLLIFYSKNPKFVMYALHQKLIIYNQAEGNIDYFPQLINEYMQAIVEYTLARDYLPASSKYGMIGKCMHLGLTLRYQDFIGFKQFIFKDEFAYMIIFNHEQLFKKQQIQTILSEYMDLRLQYLLSVKKSQMKEIAYYLNTKYPKLKYEKRMQQLSQYEQNIIEFSQFSDRKVRILKKLQQQYINVKVNYPLRLAFVDDHCISFCDHGSQIYLNFIVKLIKLIDKKKKIKIHIIPSNQLLTPKIEQLKKQRILIQKQSKNIINDNPFYNKSRKQQYQNQPINYTEKSDKKVAFLNRKNNDVRNKYQPK